VEGGVSSVQDRVGIRARRVTGKYNSRVGSLVAIVKEKPRET